VTATYRIAAIPGDGIGREVLPVARLVLDEAADRRGFRLAWTNYEWGCEFYRREGHMMPDDGIEQLRRSDAIFLGAVGAPDIPDHISLWGLLIPIRREFRQFVNKRPIRLLPGVRSPLEGAATRGIDLICVRENNEGEYSELGGRMYRGRAEELAMQVTVFTRHGVERVMRYAFELAQQRRGKLASITKSNGIIHTLPFWDEVCHEISLEYPEVEQCSYHVDAAAALLVQKPESFDVIVASNLFGDILTDLGAAVVGSIGMAPSANIDPTRQYPSMFEPIHGSAPDIAGRGVANPVGQMWCGSMMLEQLGQTQAAADVMSAVESVLEAGEIRTRDLGGTATTESFTAAVLDAL
jgi:tartrate dehydrogenase/decarboxylase/D-malate dehydrogenase